MAFNGWELMQQWRAENQKPTDRNFSNDSYKHDFHLAQPCDAGDVRAVLGRKRHDSTTSFPQLTHESPHRFNAYRENTPYRTHGSSCLPFLMADQRFLLSARSIATQLPGTNLHRSGIRIIWNGGADMTIKIRHPHIETDTRVSCINLKPVCQQETNTPQELYIQPELMFAPRQRMSGP